MNKVELVKRDQATLKQVEKLKSIGVDLSLDVINNVKVRVTNPETGKTVTILQPTPALIRSLQLSIMKKQLQPKDIAVYEGKARIHLNDDGYFSRDFKSNFFSIIAEIQLEMFLNK